MEDDRAVVDFGGKRGASPREEIERFWTGRFRLLWKMPPVVSPVVRMWHQGPDVRWIEAQLDLFEGKQPPGGDGPWDGSFDRTLQGRVMAFQRRHGLVADGRVGPQTLIQLSAVSADPAVPVLRPTGGRG
jgi:general secretion pathway protein A